MFEVCDRDVWGFSDEVCSEGQGITDEDDKRKDTRALIKKLQLKVLFIFSSGKGDRKKETNECKSWRE